MMTPREIEALAAVIAYQIVQHGWLLEGAAITGRNAAAVVAIAADEVGIEPKKWQDVITQGGQQIWVEYLLANRRAYLLHCVLIGAAS